MIRHGEADYTDIDKGNFIGFGRDLAPLKNCKDLDINYDKLKNAEIIVSSPITRALQTAAYITRETRLDLVVDVNLHEWLPDVTQQYKNTDEMFKLYKDFLKNSGVYSSKKQVWESLENLQNRIRKVLDKYYGEYESIVIVAHSMVCKVCAGNINIENGEIVEFDYTPDYEFPNWF